VAAVIRREGRQALVCSLQILGHRVKETAIVEGEVSPQHGDGSDNSATKQGDHESFARAAPDPLRCHASLLLLLLDDASNARLDALIALDRDASVIQDALIKDNATLLTNALTRKQGDVPGILKAGNLFLSPQC